MKLNDIISDPQVFLDDLFDKAHGIDLKPYFLDHICYRVGSVEEYLEKKEQLKAHGDMLIESMVNGRMIATFKLHQPIVYKERLIDVVELPAPKPGHSYKSGLEHAEFVSGPLSDVVEKYPHLEFDTSGINKAINADITLRLGEFCIRFHNQTLESVIAHELKQMESNV